MHDNENIIHDEIHEMKITMSYSTLRLEVLLKNNLSIEYK